MLTEDTHSIESLGITTSKAKEFLDTVTERPNIVLEVGSSLAGAIGRPTVRKAFREGEFSQHRYVSVDQSIQPLTQERYSIGLQMRLGGDDSQNELLHQLFDTQVSEIWLANVGGILDITLNDGQLEQREEFYSALQRLLNKNGEIIIVDSFTKDLRINKDKIILKLQSVFPDIEILDLSTKNAGVREIQNQYKEHPFILEYTKSSPAVVLILKRKSS